MAPPKTKTEVWYRMAKELSPAELEREEMEDIGGVREKDGVHAWPADEEPQPEPQSPPELDVQEPQAAPQEQADQVPPSESEQQPPPAEPVEPVDQEELATANRVLAIQDVMGAAGVEWPAHDGCRCRVRALPGSMKPIWESSPGACQTCLDYERKFNQFVQGSDVTVSA